MKPKHVEQLVARWLAEELSPGTIKNRMAVLRWTVQKLGKDNIVERTNDAYGIPDRVYVTNISKAKELGMEQLASIRTPCARMSPRLQAGFGLRREASIKIVPAWADRGDTLVLKDSWNKGGREIRIPVRTPEQRQLLDEAKALAKGMHLVGAAAGGVVLPMTIAQAPGTAENITDWALDQFGKHYQPGRGKKARPITKEAIFHYGYGVLHDPVYRQQYALNLKREFPRIPFYADFWQWADWGKVLMGLHLGYESVAPCPLTRTDVPDDKAHKAGLAPKAMLKADKDVGRMVLDSETALSGVPAEAWDYRLGNRCALEWILDQYKEKTPRDPTIRAKFNTYRFAGYKEKVIDLLMRVTTVSVETQKIVEAMRAASR